MWLSSTYSFSKDIYIVCIKHFLYVNHTSIKWFFKKIKSVNLKRLNGMSETKYLSTFSRIPDIPPQMLKTITGKVKWEPEVQKLEEMGTFSQANPKLTKESWLLYTLEDEHSFLLYFCIWLISLVLFWILFTNISCPTNWFLSIIS